MKKALAVIGFFCLASCTPQSPPPSPSPSPTPLPSPSSPPVTEPSPKPTPTPIPSPPPVPVPTGAFDCAHPQSLSGVVKVKEPIAGKYIVRFKAGGVRLQSDVRVTAQNMGATSVRVLSHGFAGVMSLANVKAAAARSDVQYIQEDGKKRAISIPWSLDRIDARSGVDNSYTPPNDGSGVKVIIIDTGIVPQPDFAGRVAPENFTAFAACDSSLDHAHGTFVSSEVAGTTFGVAKKATLVCDRVLDVDGSGSDSDVIAGVDWAASQKQAHPTQAYVASMSLGGGASPALDQSVCDAIAVGLPFAIAAGNDGANALNDSPARVFQALTVAASDVFDGAADFTNWGPVVDLYAPGVNVPGTVIGGIDAWDGTSMATPLVSGAMALLLHDNPILTPAQLHALIVSNATVGAISGNRATTPNRLLYVGE